MYVFFKNNLKYYNGFYGCFYYRFYDCFIFKKNIFWFIFSFPKRMDDKSYRNIFDYVTKHFKPLSFWGKENKNKWKSFKKKCKNFVVVFPTKNPTQTIETGTLFRRCWSPTFKRHLQKIVIRQSDLPKIWEHFHLSSDCGGHRGKKKLK